jgi:hypothetical protein
MRSMQLSMEHLKLLTDLTQETVAGVASTVIARLVGEPIRPSPGHRLSVDDPPGVGADLLGSVTRKATPAAWSTTVNEPGQPPGDGADPRGLSDEESAHDKNHQAWAKKAQERAKKKAERRRKKR